MTRKIIPPASHCNTCNIVLDDNNKAIDKHSAHGFLRICKGCKNIRYRKRLGKTPKAIVTCLMCKKEIQNIGGNNYCSLDCKLKQYTVNPNGCWIWNGCTYKGVPYAPWHYKHFQVKTTLYLRKHKKIPKNHTVRPSCNQHLCVNPKHAYLYDYTKARRLFIPEIIHQIDYQFFEAKWSLSDIARYHKCTHSTIQGIIDRTQYAEIPRKYNLHYKPIINNCEKCLQPHENSESQYCSPKCMQEFLLK